MQNIQRYFGYEVCLMDELDPVRLSVLKEKAEKIRALHDFSEQNYNVYFHQLSLIPDTRHFSSYLSIEEKILKLDLTFSVNQKQVKNRKIKLFNFLLDSEYTKDVKKFFTADLISYALTGSMLKNEYGFRNEIVTFVAKSLRKDHRKLKVSVSCQPTELMRGILTKKIDAHLTQVDFRLDGKNVSLLYKKVSNSFTQLEHKGYIVMNKYINHGQVVAQGENALGIGNTLNQQQAIPLAEMQQLRAELILLRKQLKAMADTENVLHDMTLGEIASAQVAIENNDSNTAIEHLKKCGQWALETSQIIGTTLLTTYLQGYMGG